MEPTQSSNRPRTGSAGERPAPGYGAGSGGDENMEIKAQREDIDSIEQLDQANREFMRNRQQSVAREEQNRRYVAESEPMDVMAQREDIDPDMIRDRTDVPRQAQRGRQQPAGGTRRQAMAGGEQFGSQEMSKFRADLDDFISRIPGMSGMDLNAAKEKLLSSLSSSRESAMHYASGAREQINQRVEATGEYVREKPIQSLGMAAGVGFLLGLLVSRR